MTTYARYEVGIPGEITGFYSSFRRASNHAIEGGYIYDRMAHIGKAQLWHVINGDLRVQSVRLATRRHPPSAGDTLNIKKEMTK